MAELNTGGGGEKGGKVRSKKANSRVDLTAMVDLAFLLITFFMLTTSLSKPQSMDLGMPAKPKPNEPISDIEVADNRTMTVVLGADNKVKWFMGKLSEPLEGPTATVYGKEGLRKELLSKVVSIPIATGDPKKGIIVVIKPGAKSTYRNLVDVLDEMAICKVKIYAIDNITPEEKALIEK
jgi:biopolymer transport protein ExbD